MGQTGLLMAEGAASPAGAIVVARVATLGMGLITAPLLARALGPGGRGLAASAIAALALAPIAIGLGLPLAVRRRATSQPADQVLRGARVLVFAMFVPATVTGLLITPLLLEPLDARARVIFVGAMALTPALVALLCDQSYLIVQGQYRKVAVLQLAQPAFNATGVIAGAIMGRLTVEWAIASYGAATIAAACLTGLLAGVSLRGPRVSARAILRESITYSGGQVAEAAGNRLDQVLVVAVIGAGQAGFYAAAVTVAAIPLSFGHAIGAAIFRDLAGGGETAARARGRGIRMALIAGGASAALLAAVTPWAIPLVFGREFSDAVPVTLLLLVSGPAVVAGYLASIALAAANRGTDMTLAQLAGLCADIALLYFLGPRMGAAGAALASVIGYSATLLAAVVQLRIPPAAFVPRLSDGRAFLALLLGPRAVR